MHFLSTLTLIFVANYAHVAADLAAFDVSQAQAPYNSNFWACAGSAGYGKAVIRAYEQACGSGGQVDPNFVPAYKAAKAGGIPKVDAYMFPCTGTQPTGVACKSPQTQINELLNVISANKIDVEYIWFDVEPTSGTCNAWNLGASANFALAKQWVSLLKATGLQWGIYGNGSDVSIRNQWSGIFPSRSSNIGSDLPLWAVQDDGKPGVSTVTTFMGGWTKAFAKQYSLDTKTSQCGGSLDLDSFAS
ncbi:hypothetical protein MMC14_004242 [Varicellaria rhodocarpa]|nr:hypothetical protein [Varicellaria rhodocarpa]